MNVFVCHTEEDQAAATSVCRLLEAEGIGCWLPSRDGSSSEDGAAAIIRAIHDSDLVFLVFSASANTSPYVLREVERAVAYERPVLSIHLDDAIPNPSLEYYLNLWQWLDARAGIDSRREEIVAAVRQQLATVPAATPAIDAVVECPPAGGDELLSHAGEDAPSAPRRRSRVWVPAVALAAAAIAVGLGFGVGFNRSPAGWTKLNPSGELPSGRVGQSVAYDSAENVVVVFGGQGPAGFLNDTWAYDPEVNAWTRRQPSGSVPSARAFQAMAYDSDAKLVVLFGGLDPADPSTSLDDTWTYDPSSDTWTEVHPVGPVPSARAGHSMEYDPITKRIILFGGAPDFSDTAGSADTTWTYDTSANTWTGLTTAGTGPTARLSQVTAYDPKNALIFVFGGAHAPRDFADLWTYDPSANTWTQLKPPGVGPKGRNGAGLAFDTRAGRLILFGGFGGGDTVSASGLRGDTWEYDCAKNSWTEIEPSGQTPAARQFPSVVYCPIVERTILFGGVRSKALLNDTWEFWR